MLQTCTGEKENAELANVIYGDGRNCLQVAVVTFSDHHLCFTYVGGNWKCEKKTRDRRISVSYTHLTLPTNREV